MPRLTKPFAIQPGSTLGIVAPAGPVDAKRLRDGERVLREEGFDVAYRRDLSTRRGYLAGEDARRAEEFMAFVEDPAISAILCARGGYGSMRIISRLDAAKVRAAGKPLVGFSDITALLLWQLGCAGLVGFHGPMAAGPKTDSLRGLFATLAGEGGMTRWHGRAWGGGKASGRLVGGSLSLLVASLGTSWEISTQGAILLIEEVGEAPYRIDRMLCQLHEAGKFKRLAGIGIGELTDCVDPRYPSPSAARVVREGLGELGVPLVTGLPFGHGAKNRIWPLGVRAEIAGDSGSLRILESGVRTGRGRRN